MTVGELRERMTSEEFVEWNDFDERRHAPGWKQTAAIVAALHNVFGGGKGRRRFQADDFLPRLATGPKIPAGPEQIRAKFAAFRDRHNAFVSRLPVPSPA